MQQSWKKERFGRRFCLLVQLFAGRGFRGSPVGFGFVKFSQLLVKMAHGRVGRCSRHFPALFGTLDVERAIILHTHFTYPYAAGVNSTERLRN
jgi:hypothetical protein